MDSCNCCKSRERVFMVTGMEAPNCKQNYFLPSLTRLWNPSGPVGSNRRPNIRFGLCWRLITINMFSKILIEEKKGIIISKKVLAFDELGRPFIILKEQE